MARSLGKGGLGLALAETSLASCPPVAVSLCISSLTQLTKRDQLAHMLGRCSLRRRPSTAHAEFVGADSAGSMGEAATASSCPAAGAGGGRVASASSGAGGIMAGGTGELLASLWWRSG